MRPDAATAFLRRLGRPAWTAQAACRGAETRIFFVEAGANLERARGYCDRCEVAAQCLAFALERSELGMWGGTSPKERRGTIRAA